MNGNNCLLLAKWDSGLTQEDKYWNSMYIASYRGIVFNVELLLKIRRSPEGANKDGFTCLHAAAEQGHFDVARLLLSPKYHANPNVFSKQQTTPLYHAVKVGNVDLVDLLLQCGADPALGQKGGWKPIHEACRGGNAEIVRLLMEYGGYSFVDEPNYAVKGYTPLMIAVARGASAVEVASYLLDCGANIRAASRTGMTALHIAVYWNYLDLVELLVERGAELDVQNRRGRTPLRIAESFGYEEVAKYLADKMGAIVEQPEVVRSPKRINTKDPLQVTAPITFDAA